MYFNLFLNVCFSLQLSLADLESVDAELAEGLHQLMRFEEGVGPIEDILGVDFTASSNPLLAKMVAVTGSPSITVVSNILFSIIVSEVFMHLLC
jgi:hypothetical protein